MIWLCSSGPRVARDRTLELVVHHTDGEREYAYDRDPILGSSTDQVLAAAAEHKWTVIDMAADWATIHPRSPSSAAAAGTGEADPAS